MKVGGFLRTVREGFTLGDIESLRGAWSCGRGSWRRSWLCDCGYDKANAQGKASEQCLLALFIG